MTGYPFVDANMRELAASGYMSNRGRQVVASFLVRDMALDWRLGAMHFESCLLDHDVCSNYGNWQYSAGVGSDPRDDRYFNIIKQTKMYDPSCAFIRLWIPEIAHLPDAYLGDPRLLTTDLREEYKLNGDSDGQCVYPPPVVGLLHGFFDEKKANKALNKKQRAKKTFHGDIPGMAAPSLQQEQGDQSSQG
jgi:deoxyribodipyrimidine photo-lyase